MVCSMKQHIAMSHANAVRLLRADHRAAELRALRIANALNLAAARRHGLTFPAAAFSAEWDTADALGRIALSIAPSSDLWGDYRVLSASVQEDTVSRGWYHIEVRVIRLSLQTGKPDWTYDPFVFPVSEDFLRSLPGFQQILTGVCEEGEAHAKSGGGEDTPALVSPDLS